MPNDMEAAIKVKEMPLWEEIERLSDRDKLDLIALISASLAQSLQKGAKEKKQTREMIRRFAGSWKGQNSAEEIISIINKGRKSSPTPLQF